MKAADPVLVDAGALIAFYETRDPLHKACVEQAKLLPAGKSFTCWPVLTEAAYRLRHYPDARTRLLESVRDGIVGVLSLTSEDISGIVEIFNQYADQEVDLADACLVHLANREGIMNIFTTDRRHFHIYRNSHGKPFQLLPTP